MLYYKILQISVRVRASVILQLLHTTYIKSLLSNFTNYKIIQLMIEPDTYIEYSPHPHR